LGASWLWKFQRWLRSSLKRARVARELGDQLVAELFDKATNPTRRADIYVYVLFRSTEIEADHTRQIINSYALGTWIIFYVF
jgi:hypothetical protein